MLKDETVNVDDIIETSNHLRCIDLIIENRSKKLSEAFTNELHWVLKSWIYDSRKAWFAVGNYKKQLNKDGGEITELPVEVHAGMCKLLSGYETAASGDSSCSRSACGLALCRSAETGTLDEPCRTYTPSGLIPKLLCDEIMHFNKLSSNVEKSLYHPCSNRLRSFSSAFFSIREM